MRGECIAVALFPILFSSALPRGNASCPVHCAYMTRGDLPCSVITPVRNGGQRFEKSVRSALACREHVVVYGQSTDDTVAIAERYGCRAIPQDPQFLDATGRIINFGAINTQAYKATTQEWVVFLAADEELSPEFLQAIERAIHSGRKGAYLVDRLFVINGRIMKYFSTTHNRQIRFCHRDCVLGFTKAVHERPVLAEGVVPQVLEGGVQYLVLSETAAELKQKYLRYLALDKDRMRPLAWLPWLRFTVHRMAIMAMLLLRMLWIRIVHHPADCLPLEHDMLNVWYGWQLIKRKCPLQRA